MTGGRGERSENRTAALRWLIHLTTLTLVGGALGAASSGYFGWQPPVGAVVGASSLGLIAILRRWSARPGRAGPS